MLNEGEERDDDVLCKTWEKEVLSVSFLVLIRTKEEVDLVGFMLA